MERMEYKKNNKKKEKIILNIICTLASPKARKKYVYKLAFFDIYLTYAPIF